VVEKTVCEAVSYLNMTTALSESAATQIWKFRCDHRLLVKDLIDTAESLTLRIKIAGVFESRSQSFNNYSCSSKYDSYGGGDQFLIQICHM